MPVFVVRSHGAACPVAAPHLETLPRPTIPGHLGHRRNHVSRALGPDIWGLDAMVRVFGGRGCGWV
jgi:hypothetical protein